MIKMNAISTVLPSFSSSSLGIKIQHYIIICCGSILPLVQFLVFFVLFMVMYDNELKTKENII